MDKTQLHIEIHEMSYGAATHGTVAEQISSARKDRLKGWEPTTHNWLAKVDDDCVGFVLVVLLTSHESQEGLIKQV